MNKKIRIGLLLVSIFIIIFLPSQADGNFEHAKTVASICASVGYPCVHIHFNDDCQRATIGAVVEDVSISISGWPGFVNHAWTNPYQLESYPYDFTLQIVFPTEPQNTYTQQFKGTLLEPGDCSTCESTRRYYMYTLSDENQPPTWQTYCYIISNHGVPSVGSQARICSVPGYNYTYKATNIPFAGWVSTDCDGNASYGWPAWQASWYRSKYAK